MILLYGSRYPKSNRGLPEAGGRPKSRSFANVQGQSAGEWPVTGWVSGTSWLMGRRRYSRLVKASRVGGGILATFSMSKVSLLHQSKPLGCFDSWKAS